jgi:hypothetical protein
LLHIAKKFNEFDCDICCSKYAAIVKEVGSSLGPVQSKNALNGIQYIVYNVEFFWGEQRYTCGMPIQFVVHDNIYVEFKSLILPNHVPRMFQFLLELLHWYVRKNSQYVAACVKFSNLLYYRPNIWFALVLLFINKKFEFQNVHNLEWFIKENLSNSTHYFIIFPSDCIVLYYYLCASKIIRHVLSSDRLLLMIIIVVLF